MRYDRFVAATAILLAALAFAPAASADIYTWEDASGITHYSSTRPVGERFKAFPTDPAIKAAADAAHTNAAETEALRERVDRLESQLDRERLDHASDLQRQLENERNRTQRLESELSRASESGGWWNAPAFYPGAVIFSSGPRRFSHHRDFGHRHNAVRRFR